MQSIKSDKDAWNKMSVKAELIKEEEVLEEETEEEVKRHEKSLQEAQTGMYVTRSGRVSGPLTCLNETAYAVINETFERNLREETENVTKETIKCTYARKAFLFQKALKRKPEEAIKALREVTKAIKIDIWEPVHPDNMTIKEKILPPFIR
jgi:hypothetical protein